jgi:hypothetical protein
MSSEGGKSSESVTDARDGSPSCPREVLAGAVARQNNIRAGPHFAVSERRPFPGPASSTHYGGMAVARTGWWRIVPLASCRLRRGDSQKEGRMGPTGCMGLCDWINPNQAGSWEQALTAKGRKIRGGQTESSQNKPKQTSRGAKLACYKKC